MELVADRTIQRSEGLSELEELVEFFVSHLSQSVKAALTFEGSGLPLEFSHGWLVFSHVTNINH